MASSKLLGRYCALTDNSTELSSL